MVIPLRYRRSFRFIVALRYKLRRFIRLGSAPVFIKIFCNNSFVDIVTVGARKNLLGSSVATLIRRHLTLLSSSPDALDAVRALGEARPFISLGPRRFPALFFVNCCILVSGILRSHGSRFLQYLQNLLLRSFCDSGADMSRLDGRSRFLWFE